jgi:hypothetical protein
MGNFAENEVRAIDSRIELAAVRFNVRFKVRVRVRVRVKVGRTYLHAFLFPKVPYEARADVYVQPSRLGLGGVKG